MQTDNIIKNDPRVMRAWTWFDWANSAYNLAITVAIFPVYYQSVTQQAYQGTAERTIVDFFGWKVESGVLYSFALSASFLIAAVLSPMLAGVADYGGKKKLLMKFFSYLGAAACFTLVFFTGRNVELGILAALVASLGYAASVVFYNSYLPDIATEDRWDTLSARGFAMGFIGSDIQLAISLAIILNATAFGLADASYAPRVSFVLVALWWVGFAQIAFRRLPNPPRRAEADTNLVAHGFRELQKVWQSLRGLPQIKRFLWAFFFYSMGAQTVLLLATLFGSKMIKLDTQELIILTLVLQMVAVVGAYLIAWLSGRIGNRNALLLLIVGWAVICCVAYFVTTKAQYYGVAATVGILMGAVHLSRSTYAKLLPADTPDTTSYFSFYDVTEKLAIVGGTFTYGVLSWIFDMRTSIIALTVFFFIGLGLLWRVRVGKN